MSNAAAAFPLSPAVVSIALADLRTTASFRDGGLDRENVDRLVALGGQWPPILVSRDRVVIDGVHRVAAARELGFDHIEASFFDGAPDEVLIEFVRRNVHHGLPLTLTERKRAASGILRSRPNWSDRRIAELCAISPKTVARLRPVAGERPTEDNAQLDMSRRVGRDNKCRPVNRASARSRVIEELEAHPNASLRTIAAAAQVSPETVRAVRMKLNTGAPPAPQLSLYRVLGELAVEAPAPWNDDAALRSSEEGEDFVAWFDRTAIGEAECWRRLDAVPLSRIYEIADEARRRSEVWLQFARSLEARTANVR